MSRRRGVGLVAAVAVAAALVALVLANPFEKSPLRVEIAGLEAGAYIGQRDRDALEVVVTAKGSGIRSVTATVDGRQLVAKGRDPVFRYRPGPMSDGSHELVVTVDGPGEPWREVRPFVVDTKPPTLRISAPTKPVDIKAAVTITGRAEHGAIIRVSGKPLKVNAGTFRMRFPRPPAEVLFVATDRAGNETTRRVTVPVRHPGLQAVHVTAFAWATPSLRNRVLKLIREGRINAVELDIKDESGIVGYNSRVPFARRINAVRRIYDIRKAVAQLHAMKVRVIGRIVAFRDPVHAQAAWRAGDRDQVIQAPNGTPYAKYGGFTNFANPVVRQYNIDLAVEAARAGFDDILYDYIRRPDGPIATMRFPGIRGTPEDEIVRFTAESRERLRPLGAYVGVSVFGVAATRPREVAQDIPRLARYADYIAPMLYPSHWARGEYGVADPNRQPFDIVARSLKDFLASVRGTSAAVIPWLQDFSLGVDYGPAEVAAQIRAARSVGIPNFLLWDPAVTYTEPALPPRRR